VAAENALAVRGVREVELETAIDNAAGIAFWTSRGYRTVGTIPRYYLNRVDALCMTKFLPAPYGQLQNPSRGNCPWREDSTGDGCNFLPNVA